MSSFVLRWIDAWSLRLLLPAYYLLLITSHFLLLTSSVYGALIDLLERIGRRKYFYLVERLRAIQALPMVDGPVFEIHLEAVIVFLKEVRSPAKGAHDRFHALPFALRHQINLPAPAECSLPLRRPGRGE
jgi:hypothetical protein